MLKVRKVSTLRSPSIRTLIFSKMTPSRPIGCCMGERMVITQCDALEGSAVTHSKRKDREPLVIHWSWQTCTACRTTLDQRPVSLARGPCPCWCVTPHHGTAQDNDTHPPMGPRQNQTLVPRALTLHTHEMTGVCPTWHSCAEKRRNQGQQNVLFRVGRRQPIDAPCKKEHNPSCHCPMIHGRMAQEAVSPITLPAHTCNAPNRHIIRPRDGHR